LEHRGHAFVVEIARAPIHAAAREDILDRGFASASVILYSFAIIFADSSGFALMNSTALRRASMIPRIRSGCFFRNSVFTTPTVCITRGAHSGERNTRRKLFFSRAHTGCVTYVMYTAPSRSAVRPEPTPPIDLRSTLPINPFASSIIEVIMSVTDFGLE